ncbi:MAG: cell division protein FtsZ [Oscillospiraceae bacterium]|nr:cell division protein FtsZ [Oscillospiraceae bacterium]
MVKSDIKFEAVDIDDINDMYDVKIVVVGVGGGGGNALNRMIKEGVSGVEYISVNTDARALKNSTAPTKIPIGEKLTRGRGAGNQPSRGKESAEENEQEIRNAIKGADMVFITAGMGGGTGTGAAPVVAKIAREEHALTVGVVTKPFHFEGSQKMLQASKGIEEFAKYADSLIVIPNQNILPKEANAKFTMRESFFLSDDVLKNSVKNISELITKDGFVNLDFADVSEIMRNSGIAHIGFASGTGTDKVKEIVDNILDNPLLETGIKDAKKLLLNIEMAETTLSTEIDSLTRRIAEEVDEDVELIFGTIFDENLEDEIKITVIATGIPEPDSSVTEKEPEPAEEVPDEDAIISVVNHGLEGYVLPEVPPREEETDAIEEIMQIFRR